MDAPSTSNPTVGSLFAGIGGFDLGFEQAGFKTAWQVEINPVCRAVLANRFPHAVQHEDVQTCLPALSRVDVVVVGFPCQDVSTMGKRRGLAGSRTGLFFDAMRIVQTLQPRWLVLENVPGLLTSNDGQDFQTVLETLAECGYVGFWRMLDSRYFGVPTKRRRVFVVAGFRELPPQSCWVMPEQWSAYLARRKRAAPGRTLTLRCLQVSPTGQVSTSRAEISSLSPDAGIRWISGGERLSIMGFGADWMRPTLRRLGLRETPSVRRSPAGLPKNSSKPSDK